MANCEGSGGMCHVGAGSGRPDHAEADQEDALDGPACALAHRVQGRGELMVRRSRLRAAALAISLTAGLTPALLGSVANAEVSLLPITCTAAGTVVAVDGGTIDSWAVAGRGSCQGDLGGTYFVEFAGAGESEGLGLCDNSLVVRSLDILVSGTLTNAATGGTKPLLQNWDGPLTTYPIATPFIVSGVNGGNGAGSIFNHIFLNCTGSPAAQFTWSFFQ